MVEVSDVLLLTAAAFVAFAVVAMYRVVRGPTMHDRVVAVNVVGTNTAVAIALVGGAFDQGIFLDIALVYALLNFLLSIAISKFSVEHGGVL